MTTYFVQDENTLGYVIPEQPHSLWVMGAIIYKGTLGADWMNGSIPFDETRSRAATADDFLRFRVSPKGHLP